LSFIIYSRSIFYIIKLKFQRYLHLAYLFVCFTLLNPYLLDFFSLARGYGLSVVFISLSILMLLYYFKQRRRRYLVFHFILSLLAILSNLVLIACSMLAIIISSLFWDRRELINILMVCLPILALSAILFFTSITALLDKNEFQYGVPYLFDS